jgi:hypothetical protein
VLLPRPPRGGVGAIAGPPAAVFTLQDAGPPDNRVDLVFVGDGFIETGLDLYAAQVEGALEVLFAEEPFTTYRSYFNVHRVDVVSNESGVDNDPLPGIERDTALGMGFWCAGIERLLCVDVAEAHAFTSAAPGVDQVFAVANSTKYGGAGYTGSDLVTFAGGNAQASAIAVHEIGHSLGNLADEYDYGDGARYGGPERPERNVSILSAAEMEDEGAKWAAWLGAPGVGTFEGGYYHEFGIFRPSAMSKMRALGHPFNLPSIEGFIIEIYRLVDPIDDATPAGTILGPQDVVFVDPLDPVGHALVIDWRLDGVLLAGEGAATLNLGAFAIAPGWHTVAVTVSDPTEMVRDEAAREECMTATLVWTLLAPGASCPADVDGDGTIGLADLLAVSESWGRCPEPCAGDLNGDGAADVRDLIEVIVHWGPCAP